MKCSLITGCAQIVWRIFEGKNQTKRYGFQCLGCGRSGRKGFSGNMDGSYTWVSDKRVHEYFELDYREAKHRCMMR